MFHSITGDLSEYYDFGHVPCFQTIDQSIDQLKVSDAMTNRLVREANDASQFNMQLFLELKGKKSPDEVIQQQNRDEEKEGLSLKALQTHQHKVGINSQRDMAEVPFNKLFYLFWARVST